MLSFVKKDLEILQSAHDVRELHFKGIKDIYSLFISTIWADLTFSWFGKLHAFFAVLFSKILGKRTVVVAGGDDVVYEPETKYGMFSHWWKKWCPLFVFKNADLILSVSKYNTLEAIKNAKANQNKMRMIYHGFDHKRFCRHKDVKNENIILTVGNINKETLIRKGIELFVRSAEYLPEIKFYLIGSYSESTINFLNSFAKTNVVILGRVSNQVLINYMSRAKVYVQTSVHEAFGCSIAQAMLCECIPVVSDVAAIPEVVGDCGFYVERLSPENVAEMIKEALSTSEDLGKKARKRIKTVFPLEKRKRELLEAVGLLNYK